MCNIYYIYITQTLHILYTNHDFDKNRIRFCNKAGIRKSDRFGLKIPGSNLQAPASLDEIITDHELMRP